MILITGGAGFLGSHMAGFFLNKEIDFIIIDNLSNSNLTNLNKLENFFKSKINFNKIDLRDKSDLENFFDSHNISSVIHFASLKSTEESISSSELYFENNVIGSKNLFECCKKKKIRKLIFSSSATIYGHPVYLPIDEKHPINPINPYGQNKIDIEEILLNDHFFINQCSTSILRYFNPVGSFMNGLIGENPTNFPKNIMPLIVKVALGELDHLKIFGNDYNTRDGTAIRDYIHVEDLIEAHFISLNYNFRKIGILNLGLGYGFSVLELVKNFEKINRVNIPYRFYPRRLGDAETVFSLPNQAKQILNWNPIRGIKEMCRDSYLFAKGKK